MVSISNRNEYLTVLKKNKTSSYKNPKHQMSSIIFTHSWFSSHTSSLLRPYHILVITDSLLPTHYYTLVITFLLLRTRYYLIIITYSLLRTRYYASVITYSLLRTCYYVLVFFWKKNSIYITTTTLNIFRNKYLFRDLILLLLKQKKN